MKNHVTTEEIEQARSLDLLSYFRQTNPDELVKISPGVYAMKSHDSLKISNGKWYRWSRGYGGVSALDYLMKVEDMSFVDAVQKICECRPESTPQPVITKKTNCFVLPKKNENNDRVIEYLKRRALDESTIQSCIDAGILYEDIRHNCVFVGKDENNVPRFATLRSSNPDSLFIGDVPGSNKAYSFHLPFNESDSLFIFESAIDTLSFYELCGRSKGKDNYLSVSGVYHPKKETAIMPAAVTHALLQLPQTRNVFICYDNDHVGIQAAKALKSLLSERYHVRIFLPEQAKDFNDMLHAKKGIPKTTTTRTSKQIKEETTI